MKKKELINLFRTYSISAKIDVLADLLDYNVINMGMIDSANRIVINRKLDQKYMADLQNASIITYLLYDHIFKMSKNDFKYVFQTTDNEINREEISIIVDKLHYHRYKSICDNGNQDGLANLMEYVSIFNDYIKENKVPQKKLFYDAKKKILMRLINGGYLRRWAVEKKDVNEFYYALQFDINGKMFYFHQPASYKVYQDILPIELKDDERDYSREKCNDTQIILTDKIIKQLQNVWRFILIKTYI